MEDTLTDKRYWTKQEKEYGVERIYGIGSNNFGEHHGGYLNFGWWENTNNYVEAAEALVHKMGTILGVNADSKLLDVACGMGAQNIYMHKTFGTSIDALDILWDHVNISRERVKREVLDKHIKVHYGTATKLPFDKNVFTHIMSIEGAQHFRTRDTFFKEAFRVLRSRGVMLLADFSMKRPANNLWEKLVFKAAQRFWAVPNANAYGTEIYKQKLQEAGFTNISFTEGGEHTIPGYYKEQRRKETITALKNIRGLIPTYAGFFVSYAVYKAFKSGLIEYIFVHAKKP
ncbi:methyltransferase domain-containing protein [Spirochaetota bacterium]